jgi:hypothetical protein
MHTFQDSVSISSVPNPESCYMFFPVVLVIGTRSFVPLFPVLGVMPPVDLALLFTMIGAPLFHTRTDTSLA